MPKISALYNLAKKPRKVIRVLGDKGLLNWIPDKQYLKLVYWGETGKRLNIIDPKSFNEKLQWLKLNDRKPEYRIYVDKYAVRSYIAETIGEEYLIPLIGVYDKVEEIDWDSLPDKFVLKCTHGSGSNIICPDKNKLNIEEAKKKLKKWMNKNWYWFGREWPYRNVKPRILCEKYLVDESGKELIDYKFMCFNGEVKCIFVCSNRNSPLGLNIDIYNVDWNLMPFGRPNSPRTGVKIPKPRNFNKMIEFAEKLAKDIPFIRVDFYEVDGHLYFGELTFYPTSGFGKFTPEYYDDILGSWLKLTIEK
jgi:hypothetical protein